MKKILSQGYMISNADKLAVANDLLCSLEEWAFQGVKFMVSKKPVKALLVQWMVTLRGEKQKTNENISANEDEIVDEILGLAQFTPNKYKPDGLKKPIRTQPTEDHILINGIDIEDHEEKAAKEYWHNVDQVVIDLLDNKIAMCRKRFIAEWTSKLNKDVSVISYPSDEDAFIEYVVLRQDYKNRKQREENEEII